MLRQINSFSDIDCRKLMDIYAESNYENTDYFYPETEDKACAVKKVEEGFLLYLESEFFSCLGHSYWILQEGDVWVSALRLYRLKPRFYYLEALETHPEYRKKGMASQLINEVICELKKQGSFKICDCVDKKNTASLQTHKKCGFKIVSDEGYDYLNEEADSRDYGLEYVYDCE